MCACAAVFGRLWGITSLWRSFTTMRYLLIFFPRGIFGHSSRVRAACLQIGVKLGEERTDKLFGKPCRVFISEQSLETACYMYVRNMNPAAAVCILVAIVKYILT
uniref:Putative secreted protein n=1 Tax=Ixodes scapularis TaxID=6945 RepID=A0A4D5RCS3_IXOSC